MRRTLLLVLMLLWGAGASASAEPWVTEDAQAAPQVHLWFFWSQKCPHCREALPFVEALAADSPWLVLHSQEVGVRENAERYVRMARELGQEARSVPGFLFCGEMVVGYERAETTGRFLAQRLKACQASAGATGATEADAPVSLPLAGEVDLRSLSLPLVTVIIAGLDAFNPCAFFVLLFLLSLLTHERTRTRMLVIGGVFVLFSGLVYFVLMAAWLNVFLIAGELRAVTLTAGALAVVMALINIKDFVWFKRGISLSIPDAAKPGLYARMRGLVGAESWPMLLAGTVMLAIAANSYEALCTAGFPMVYTRLLTLQHLPAASYYGYLALYNVIYVMPLLAIVMAFAYTLGSRKLSEAEGRVLKLVSGVMMLGLGGALLLAPDVLNSPELSFGLLALAAVVGVAAWSQRRRWVS